MTVLTVGLACHHYKVTFATLEMVRNFSIHRILQMHPGPGSSSVEYDGDLFSSICLGFLVQLLTRIRFKAVLKICYVLNCIKKTIGLDVFKTRNIMNFNCSLQFGKLCISHSWITYTAYLQPHSSGNAGKKERFHFRAVLSGSQWSNTKAVKILGHRI